MKLSLWSPSSNFHRLAALGFLIANVAGAATDPELDLTTTRSSAGLILQWSSLTGATYQVESSVNLSTWSNASPVLAGGGPLSFTNAITGVGPHLLRVKRVFPAAPGTAVFNPANGVLTIVGDLAHTNIDVASSGGLILVNGGALPITGGTPTTANTTLIQILGSPAADQISVGSGLAPAHIFGAEGNDTLSGGSFGDIIVGGPGADTILGRLGNDLLYLDGDDTAIWNPGDGSDVIEGQGTGNALTFNGSNVAEQITLSANGNRTTLFRDVANIILDMKGVQTINLALLGGADTVTVNSLTGTDASQINVNLAASGGGGDASVDTVVINGTAAAENFSTAANGASVEVTTPWTLVSVSGGELANDRILINGVGGDTVSVNGTSGADSMQILPSPVSGVRTTVAAYSVPVDVTGALSLTVNGLGSGDTISGANGVAALAVPITIDGGDGDDVITGTDAADLILGGAGNDTVLPARGNDVVFLGADNDTVIWNPGDGSDTIEGEGGANTLTFNGSNVAENMALSANGGRLSLTRDVAAINMDVNGIQTVNLAMLGGADNITVNSLAGVGISKVNIDLSATGGAGDASIDSVIINGTANADSFSTTANGASVEVTTPWTLVSVSGGELANDRILINGVGGDTVSVNGTSGADSMQILPSPVSGVRTTVGVYTIPVDVTGALSLVVNGLGSGDTISGANGVAALGIPITIDGGDGDDVITGTDAADLILGGAGNDTVLPARGNDVVFLGDDNDTVIWNPGDGSDTIEGEGGTNTLTFNGSNVAENMALSANGGRLSLTRDVAAINMDVNGIQTVNLATLGGADNITVNSLEGTSVTAVNIDANSIGGTGDASVDTVTINGTANADSFSVTANSGTVMTTGITPQVQILHPEAANDKLILNGLGGTDSFSIGPGVTSLITVTTNQ